MEAASSSANLWSVLIPLLVGSAVTLVSTTVAPLIAQSWNRKIEEQKLRVDKFEELLALTYEHDDWLSKKYRERVIGEEPTYDPPPLNRAFVITSLHFPKMLQALQVLDVKCSGYNLWMTERAADRLAGKMSNDGFGPVYQEYIQALAEFRNRAYDYSLARRGKV